MPTTQTYFLNVDLDIVLSDGLASLIPHLSRGAHVLQSTTRTATLELDVQPSNPEDAIASFITLIEALPQDAMRLWTQAESRTMNIGLQAVDKQGSAEFSVSNACLSKLSNLGIGIAVTVYTTDLAR